MSFSRLFLILADGIFSLAKLKCKICGSTQLVASEYNGIQKLLSLLLPLRPMQCQDCASDGLYRDRLFVNNWRISLWGIVLLLLGLVAIYNWVGGFDRDSTAAAGLVDSRSVLGKRKQQGNELFGESQTSTINTHDRLDNAVFATVFEPPVSLDSKILENSEWELIDDRPLEKSVLSSIEAWRKAIETGNSEVYFSAYHDSFNPASKGRDEWEERLRDVLASRKIQRIRFSNLSMNFSADKTAVGVKFLQNYEFETQRRESLKRMFLTKVDGKWLIAAEADEK